MSNDFASAMQVSASGMRAQSQRLRIISENLANSSSTAKTPGGDPYRRRIPVFTDYTDNRDGASMVKMSRVATDMTDFNIRYEPGNPAADEKGYVKYSNVNALVEMMDMREAQRSYEANLGVLDTARNMAGATLRILE